MMMTIKTKGRKQQTRRMSDKREERRAEGILRGRSI